MQNPLIAPLATALSGGLPSAGSLAGQVAQALGLPGAGLYDQATRLIRLHTPLGPDLLLAEDLNAWEGMVPQVGPSVNALAGRLGDMGLNTWSPCASGFVQQPTRAGMRLVVHALCQSAEVQDTLLGQPVLVELLCQDSATQPRAWHGHVTVVTAIGSDGGWFRLRLVIEPWLAWLAQGRDARLRQGMTVQQIIDDVFSGRAQQAMPQGVGLSPSWRWALSDASIYPQRSSSAQHGPAGGESDLDYVLRLMSEEGLVAWWEHNGEPGSPTLGQHTLVIADDVAALSANPQPSVRFTSSDHTLGEDSLTTLHSVRRVATQAVELTSRDYRSGGAVALQHRPVSSRANDPLALFDHSIVDHPGLYAYESLDQGERLARVQSEALQAAASRSVARGPWRRAQAGTWFTLQDHPAYGGLLGGVTGAVRQLSDGSSSGASGADGASGEFVILATQHRARNNLSADERVRGWGIAQQLLHGVGASVTEAVLGGAPSRHPDADERLHDAVLLMQPRSQPLRLVASAPSAMAHPFGAPHTGDAALDLFASHYEDQLAQPDTRQSPRPTTPAMATAIVVGSGEPVHTDRDGRIRIQHHWQRGANGSHRLAHPTGANEAPADASSHPWVRVAPVLAGQNYGACFIPRVGQEAALVYVGGDADRPVVIGSLYNGEGQPDAQGNLVFAGAAGAVGSAPAWFPGAEPAGSMQGHAHDAVLCGWRSQALASSAGGMGGSNQLVVDDTPEQRRLELGVYASPNLPDTRMQLGHLLHQHGNQRLQDRGHGLDLSTVGHGAMRAASGLLISAHARAPSTSSGQQMDSREPQSLLQAAQDLQQSLADSAQKHNAKLADEPLVAAGSADQLEAQLPAQQGLHALQASLAGTATLNGTASSELSAPDAPFPAIDGGWGTVAAWQRPELVLSAPAGVGLFTPAHAILSAGAHLSTTASQDLQVMTQASYAAAAAQGIVLFTYGQASNPNKPSTETGIALHAATGNVHLSVNSGQASLAADQSVELVSTHANLTVATPTRLILAAGGAGIEIKSGSIDLKATGPIEVHAGMKNWTGGASVSAPALSLATSELTAAGEESQFSVQFDLSDLIGMHPDTHTAVRPLPYQIRKKDGTVLAKGFTNSEGETQRLFTAQAEDVYIYTEEGTCIFSVDCLHHYGEGESQ
ncbi:type VI secretion system Vgr family protein [Ideonella sp. DXS29W]|uniref:Type VI secretion system Vgr family protein n=1 Tax=Ideonella lacteola TaxID=2984193 RepID=A0ABU9BRF4_9BURK